MKRIIPDKSYYEVFRIGVVNKGFTPVAELFFRPLFNGTNFFATPGVMMMEAVIAPDFKKENAYAEDLIDNVRDAVERHKDIKIWTMSAGTDEECDPFSFSEYGMALDNIEDENNVLIIKSAGNSLSFIRNVELTNDK